MTPRRHVLASLGLLALAPAAAAQPSGWPLAVTDLAGRRVTIPREPRAVLLGSGFDLVALSLIEPDPVARLAGWAPDLARYSPALAGAFAARFPRLRALPRTGDGGGGTLPLEPVLAAAPDLVILAGWQAGDSTLLGGLAAAGVPALVADFNQDPLRNTPASLRLLGQVLGRREQAEALAGFWESRLSAIREKLAAEPGPTPRVLLHAFPGGGDCCWVAGSSGVGGFLAAAGGRNIGEERFPGGSGGQLNLEWLITEQPDVYIATGLQNGLGVGGFSIGPGISEEVARHSLARALEAPGLAALAAVRGGRAHGLWNFFNAVPLNILAVEALARWSRPDLFAALDPGDTLAEINRRFAALPFTGTYWVSLPPAAQR